MRHLIVRFAILLVIAEVLQSSLPIHVVSADYTGSADADFYSQYEWWIRAAVNGNPPKMLIERYLLSCDYQIFEHPYIETTDYYYYEDGIRDRPLRQISVWAYYWNPSPAGWVLFGAQTTINPCS